MSNYKLHATVSLPTKIAWSIKSKWEKFRYGILLLLFFASVLVFMRWALPVVIQPRLNSFFAIESIQVGGKIEFSVSGDIQAVIQHHVNGKALYQIESGLLKEDLIALPWIETAVIERRWPHELFVRVEEAVPIALWNRTKILSDRGDVFQPESIDMHLELPSLLGVDTQIRIVTDMYRQASTILRQTRLQLKETEYYNGLIWHLTVEDKNRGNARFLIVLDADQSFDRLFRFVSLYPSLAQMEQQPKRVDLRYPTGMAVSWQEE